MSGKTRDMTGLELVEKYLHRAMESEAESLATKLWTIERLEEECAAWKKVLRDQLNVDTQPALTKHLPLSSETLATPSSSEPTDPRGLSESK